MASPLRDGPRSLRAACRIVELEERHIVSPFGSVGKGPSTCMRVPVSYLFQLTRKRSGAKSGGAAATITNRCSSRHNIHLADGTVEGEQQPRRRKRRRIAGCDSAHHHVAHDAEELLSTVSAPARTHPAGDRDPQARPGSFEPLYINLRAPTGHVALAERNPLLIRGHLHVTVGRIGGCSISRVASARASDKFGSVASKTTTRPSLSQSTGC